MHGVITRMSTPDGCRLHHGMTDLPNVRINSYNSMARDGEEFIGDRASKAAFQDCVARWRTTFAGSGSDPLSSLPRNTAIPKSELDRLMRDGDFRQRALLHSAVEEFAGVFADVVRGFLRLSQWRNTDRIVVGGGFQDGGVGRLTIGRAQALLYEAGDAIDLAVIANHPDKAGLIGAAFLLPAELLAPYGALLAVDIGGTNARCGIVKFKIGKNGEVAKAKVAAFDVWRHGEKSVSRNGVVAHIATTLIELKKLARKAGLGLAPYICVGCPGIIREDGTIRGGTQNLPGNWDGEDFNLAHALEDRIPKISNEKTLVIVHNDAVIQGLSEQPAMADCRNWGVLTIGTGLGNAHFTNI